MAAANRERLLAEVDTVAVIDVAGWYPQNAPAFLAERLGAHPAREYVTGIGGEEPLEAVNRIAEEIASGSASVALIAGCNNLKTLRRARKAGVELDWVTGGRGEPVLIGSRKLGSSELENGYGLASPPSIYPIFENALRARRGLGGQKKRAIVRLASRLSRCGRRRTGRAASVLVMGGMILRRPHGGNLRRTISNRPIK